MRPSQARFVTACQQLLALGVVLAVLTPAASVISLDVVNQAPHGTPGATGGRPAAGLSAYGAEARKSSVVPAEVVDAEVAEYELTTAAAAGRRVVAAPTGRAKIGSLSSGTQLTTAP